MYTVVLFENEHLSFLHKKVVSEQEMLLYFTKHLSYWNYICCSETIFVVLKQPSLFRNDNDCYKKFTRKLL